MFVVRRKNDCMELKKFVVFKVKNDSNGYPHFLIFEDNQWKWVSAKHFIPVKEYIDDDDYTFNFYKH